MRILIYGGGAVGLGIASCLLKSTTASSCPAAPTCVARCRGRRRQEHGVDIIARENTVKLLRMHGLLRTGIFGDYYADSTAFGSFASLKELAKIVARPSYFFISRPQKTLQSINFYWVKEQKLSCFRTAGVTQKSLQIL